MGRRIPVGGLQLGGAGNWGNNICRPLSSWREPVRILDLAGNVWEFVDAADQPAAACALRGGSFVNSRVEVKSTLRLFGVPREHRAHDFGFRCAQQPRTV